MAVLKYNNVCVYIIICLDLIALDCGTPPTITNGSPGTPDMTAFGGMVNYTCTSGYILSGSATVSCLASGGWSTRPTCTGNPESSVVDV